MGKSVRSPVVAGLSALLIVSVFCGLTAMVILIGCQGFNPVGFTSPEESGNEPPNIDVIEPNEDLPISQGESFIVRWTDSDPDDNAMISIDLVEVDEISLFRVAGGLRENDTIADLFVVDTEDIPLGKYFVRLTIDDNVNTPVVEFAEDPETTNRIQITITPAGLGTQNNPPRIYLAAPQVNAGVSQNDLLTISVRPTIVEFAVDAPDPGLAFHYDQDDDPADLTILLDFDEDPTNDNIDVDDDPGNIILEREFIPEGSFQQIDFQITIDVQEIPVRQDGLPYLIKAAITDGLNTTFSYAAARLHVLELVEGSASNARRLVDLKQIGKTLAGVRWLGFNPQANLGTKMASAMDIDNDGIGDFVIIAQFGNPRNRGNIGEAYLIYGNTLRFGGDININSVATELASFNRVRGTVFHPHKDFIIEGVVDLAAGDDLRIREMNRPLTDPYTLGITDVVAVSNLGGTTADEIGDCGLPELVFGIPHNEYMGTTRDDDLGDDPEEDSCMYCYPDDLPNNYCNDFAEDDPSVFIEWDEGGAKWAHEEKMGTVALWYGENNLANFDQDAEGDPCDNLIAPTTEVMALTSCGSQNGDEQTHFGARFNVAIFDNFGNLMPAIAPFRVDPLNAHYGMNVAVLPDVDLNGLDEIIISAPRNEIEVEELRAEFGENHPHVSSRIGGGNVIIFLGQDFSSLDPAPDNTTHIPFITTRAGSPSCSDDQPVRRWLETEYDEPRAGASHTNPFNDVTVRPGWFQIFGEKATDKLGGARSAGDFNLDGPTDIICGAPFADPELDTDNNGFPDTVFQDAGTIYIVYSRLPFGTTELALANFKQFRPPMLRVFGENQKDHLGLKQESGQDVNGDAIDDVFIASKDYNGQGLVNNGFVGIIFGGQRIDGDRVVSQIATTELNGTRFYGTHNGDMAGADVSTAGDFNQDGLGDLLISAPGELVDPPLPGEDKPRHGVVYLIFGGKHLENKVFTLNQVGTEALPGIVFVGPYQQDTPDAFELDKPVFVTSKQCDPAEDIECLCDPEIQEDCVLLEDVDGTFELRRIDDAAPERVGFLGDVNGDGFDDIMIGNPTADFFDPSLPGEARRPDAGEAYLIYGNNFGANTIILANP